MWGKDVAASPSSVAMGTTQTASCDQYFEDVNADFDNNDDNDDHVDDDDNDNDDDDINDDNDHNVND